MSPTRQEVRAEIMKAARMGQEVVTEAIRTSAGAVRSARTQEHLASLPFASRLPKPEQLAGTAREFAGKLRNPEEVAANARQLAGKLRNPEELAATARQLAGKLPMPSKLAGNARLITGKLPRVEELTANARHFAERLLATQQKFAEDALRATAALLPAASDGNKARTTQHGTGATAASTGDDPGSTGATEPDGEEDGSGGPA